MELMASFERASPIKNLWKIGDGEEKEAFTSILAYA